MIQCNRDFPAYFTGLALVAGVMAWAICSATYHLDRPTTERVAPTIGSIGFSAFCSADGSLLDGAAAPNCADYYKDGLAAYRVVNDHGIHVFSLHGDGIRPLADFGTGNDGDFVQKGRARDAAAFMRYVAERARFERPVALAVAD